jgi:CHAD domain-containing protein
MATTRSELLLRQRLAALKRTLPAAQAGDVKSLHKARVATRRLRETLPVVAGRSTARKLQRKMRRLTRALGPVRELDVALQILDQLEGTPDVPPAAVSCLRQEIARERAALQGPLHAAIERANLKKLERRAMAAAQDGGRQPSPAGPRQADTSRTRAARRAERLRAAIESASALYLPERLHDVRIAVKKLRYALEVTTGAGGARGQARIRTLKRAQDLLGRLHDLEVLVTRIRAVQGAESAPSLKLSGELDRLVRRLETECRQLHAHYIGLRKALLAICDQVAARRARRRRKDAA